MVCFNIYLFDRDILHYNRNELQLVFKKLEKTHINGPPQIFKWI